MRQKSRTLLKRKRIFAVPKRTTMEKYEKIIVAGIVAVGLLMLGLCIKAGIDNFTNKDRRVTVKGLAEKVVEADNHKKQVFLQL